MLIIGDWHFWYFDNDFLNIYKTTIDKIMKFFNFDFKQNTVIILGDFIEFWIENPDEDIDEYDFELKKFKDLLNILRNLLSKRKIKFFHILWNHDLLIHGIKKYKVYKILEKMIRNYNFIENKEIFVDKDIFFGNINYTTLYKWIEKKFLDIFFENKLKEPPVVEYYYFWKYQNFSNINDILDYFWFNNLNKVISELKQFKNEKLDIYLKIFDYKLKNLKIKQIISLYGIINKLYLFYNFANLIKKYWKDFQINIIWHFGHKYEDLLLKYKVYNKKTFYFFPHYEDDLDYYFVNWTDEIDIFLDIKKKLKYNKKIKFYFAHQHKNFIIETDNFIYYSSSIWNYYDILKMLKSI